MLAGGNRLWAAFAILALLAWNAPSASSNPEASTSTKFTIVCLGDSITKAGYPEELGKLLGCRVTNAGVNGNTSRQGLARLQRDVLAYKPDLVIAFFGANDSRRDAPKIHVPLDEYASNLTAVVRRSREIGATVILGTLPPIDSEAYYQRHPKEYYEPVGGLEPWLSKYRDAALRVADSNKVQVVDLNQLLLKEPSWQKQDGVHPTDEGKVIMAKLFAKAVLPLLQGKQTQQTGR